MLPTLEVSRGTKRLKLFEEERNGYPTYIPTLDLRFERLSEDVKDDELTAIKEKARRFYRAIGRIFVHCLCWNRSVPREVLPMLLCNGEWHRRVMYAFQVFL